MGHGPSSSAAGPAAAAAASAPRESWSELPLDALQNIVDRLSTPSLPGVLLLSEVCSSWRQATLSMPVGEVVMHRRSIIDDGRPSSDASFSAWLQRYGFGIRQLSRRDWEMSVEALRTPGASGAKSQLHLRAPAASGALSQLQFLDTRLAIDEPRDADLLRKLPQLQELRGALVFEQPTAQRAAGWRALRGFRRCTSITKLQLSVVYPLQAASGHGQQRSDWAAVDSAWRQLWGCMPTSLRCLELEIGPIWPIFPPHLTVLTGLQELHLEVPHWPEQLQASLPPALRSLSIRGIDYDLLPHLPAVRSVLHSLSVCFPPAELDELDDDVLLLQQLPSLQQLTALTSLELMMTPRVLPEWFLPGLQALTLRCNGPILENATALRHLSALSSLRTLRLQWSGSDPDEQPAPDDMVAADAAAAAAVAHVQQLTRLVLWRAVDSVLADQAARDAWVAALQQLVHLKELELDPNLLQHPQPWLTTLTQLTALTLQELWVTVDADGWWDLPSELVANLQAAAAACGRLSRVVVSWAMVERLRNGTRHSWRGVNGPDSLDDRLPRRCRREPSAPDLAAELGARMSRRQSQRVPTLLVEVQELRG